MLRRNEGSRQFDVEVHQDISGEPCRRWTGPVPRRVGHAKTPPMTVFVSHAAADLAVAMDLEKAIERRGVFVELDDGETALRPVQAMDAVVMLVSKDFVFSPWRLRLEQRALDAWTQGKLVLVKLDHAFAPVGLRDLPAIDASFEAQREFTWMKVADAVRAALKAPAREPAGEPVSQAPPTRPRKKRGGWLGAVARVLLMAPGIAAFTIATSIWLANRIGPSPGTLEDLRSGVDALGVRYGAPAGVTEWLFLGAMAVTLIMFAVLVAQLVTGAQREQSAPPMRAPAPASAGQVQRDAVFVSYARANQGIVLPVIEAVQRQGRKFWLDQQGISGGDGWAGEIVRAIRGAAEVLVMCSKAAFESDHVKREIYLADRYRKKLVPVYVESAEPPEDFEYFFAGVQTLKLFETPEADRPQALMRVLGAGS